MPCSGSVAGSVAAACSAAGLEALPWWAFSEIPPVLFELFEHRSRITPNVRQHQPHFYVYPDERSCLIAMGYGHTAFPHRMQCPWWQVPQSSPALIMNYGCNGCHSIPGIAAPQGNISPSLIAVSERTYITGILLNTPENLTRWIRFPQRVSPGVAMSSLGVTEKDAHDYRSWKCLTG